MSQCSKECKTSIRQSLGKVFQSAHGQRKAESEQCDINLIHKRRTDSMGTSHSQVAKAESLMRSWVCPAIVVYFPHYLFKGGRRESGGDPRGDE